MSRTGSELVDRGRPTRWYSTRVFGDVFCCSSILTRGPDRDHIMSHHSLVMNHTIRGGGTLLLTIWTAGETCQTPDPQRGAVEGWEGGLPPCHSDDLDTEERETLRLSRY